MKENAGNDIGRGNLKVLGEKPVPGYFVQHKSHVGLPGIESGPSRWKTGYEQPKSWHVWLLTNKTTRKKI
jgi:hypothetical protein